MSRFLTRIIAVALPVVALGGSWASTHVMAQQGVDWDVPVKGYDPRDLLRGHYIRYQYDWPYDRKKDVAENEFDPMAYGAVCLIGKAPVVRVARSTTDGEGEAGCDAIVRPNAWQESGGEDGAHRDRLFVPQTQAADFEAKLRDPKLQGVVRIRVRADGVATPQSLSFRPAPPGTQGPADGAESNAADVLKIDEGVPPPAPPAAN